MTESPEGLSRRGFLSKVGMTGGATAVFAAVEAMGMLAPAAHADTVPFVPPRSGDLGGTGHRRKKIAILGAGTAGLTVAYELGKAGYDCHILEARDRPGGRAWTVRDGDKHTDTDGVTQVAHFDRGQYFNAGPSRIPAHHLTLDYCRELGVAIEPFINSNAQGFYYNENSSGIDNGPLGNTTITHRQAKADIYGYLAELLQEAVKKGHFADRFPTVEDVNRMITLTNQLGGLSTRMETLGKYVGNATRGYVEPPGAGDKPGVIGTPPPLADVFKNELGARIAFEFGYNQATQMYHPVGGMDRIAYALAREVGNQQITYKAVVTEIANTSKGVRIAYRHKGRIAKLDADYAVVTIPPMVLRDIPSNLTTATKDALKVPFGVNQGRMGIQFKRRFWEEDFKIYGGVTHTNLDISGIYYPSYDYLSGGKGVVVGYYSGAYTDVPVADRAPQAVAQGVKIHGEVYRREYDSSFSVAWPKVPYSLGGWVQWSASALDPRPPAYVHLQEPDGNTYFAGDYLSYFIGWQHGAFLSARKIVMDLHQRVTATS